MKLGAALCECAIEDELSSILQVGKLAGSQASSPGTLATAFLQQRMCNRRSLTLVRMYERVVLLDK